MLRSMDYRGLLISTASALALCIAAPAALAQAGPTAETGRDVVTITGQTIEETLPQELQKYGSDLEVRSSTRSTRIAATSSSPTPSRRSR